MLGNMLLLMLLLTINRKSCMGSPMAPSHLTLSDLEKSSQGHQNFAALCLVKEAFDIEWTWKVTVKVTNI